MNAPETRVFENGPPRKNLILTALTIIPLISWFFPIKWLILKLLRDCHACDFVTGFRCFYGNIYARKVFLGDTIFFDYAPVYIGTGSKFGFNNVVITTTHDPKKWSRVIAKSIHIGNNVWITSRCIILGGVTIGDNSIIGAGSVVTRDIPPNTFSAGNPCKVIKALNQDSELN